MAEKKTPLYELHIASGAKVIEFGGWLMPVQYSGILDEHRAVRERAGLFDVSHMGEFRVHGAGAAAFLNHLITNDVQRLAVNQILYSPMCYPDGGVVDDLLVYRLGEEEFLLVVNAGNLDKDYAWVVEQAASYEVRVENLSDKMAELALQGPAAQAVLAKLTKAPLDEIRYYWLRQDVDLQGMRCLVSRTGYTGDDGFEIYCQPQEAAALWEMLLAAGKEFGLVPAGLGARDTLRFEAGLPLYGHELSPQITPLEAGLSVFVKWDKGDFLGRDVLWQQKQEGVRRKIVGLEMLGRGIARAGYPCRDGSRQIGQVTSGSFAPTLNKNLALALLDRDCAQPGQKIDVEIREKPVAAVVISKPFYKRGK